MNKSELIGTISEAADLKVKESEALFEAMTDVIYETLANDGKVAITGFGTFSVSKRKERKGRNPRTGKEITIPASASAKFTAGKALKDDLK